jgi:hypothetical protein
MKAGVRFRIAIGSCIVSAIALVSSARADAYCNESVTQLIVKNGAVYFTTSKSCQNWCALNTTWAADSINQATSLLLSARITGQTVTFEWSDQTSPCSNTEATYSNPEAVIL